MNIDAATIALRVLPILWALTIHEFAHGWMAYRCGDDTALHAGRLTLNPLAHLDIMGTIAFLLVGFGWAKPVPVDPRRFRNPRRDDIKVSLAGVGANLLSAVAFALIFRLVLAAGGQQTELSQFLLQVLGIGVFFNLILMFFNLIPIPPLDGSHVARELLPWNARQSYDNIMRPYGRYILLGLVFLGRPILWALVGIPANVLAALLLPG